MRVIANIECFEACIFEGLVATSASTALYFEKPCSR